jgi:hypothetical protein
MAVSLGVRSFVESSEGSLKSRKLVVNASTEAEDTGEDSRVRRLLTCYNEMLSV